MEATNPDFRAPSAPVSTTPVESRPLPAAVLGGARLLCRLGVGGMGTVYLGFDAVQGRRVAVKVLAPHLAELELHVRRFQREGRNTLALDHPNIVRGLDFGQDLATGLHFLVLEYIDGGTAQRLLDRRGRLPFAEVVAIALGATRALEHAHDRGIVHRDIKPDNLFLSRAGQVKLGDLGLAKQLDDPASHLTVVTQVFGTAHYMPYEQALNARYADARSDIYALGVTLYHLLTGTVPFPGQDVAEVFQRKRQGVFAPLRQHAPDVPESLVAVIDRMLATDPRQRFPSAIEVRRALLATDLVPVLPCWAEAASAETAEPERAPVLVATQIDHASADEPWWLQAQSPTPPVPETSPNLQACRTPWWVWFGVGASLAATFALYTRLVT